MLPIGQSLLSGTIWASGITTRRVDCCSSFVDNVSQNVDKVVVGVNWRFGGFGKGKAPVVARY